MCYLQLYLDMERTLKDTGITRTSVSDSWIKIWTPRIFTQAKIESGGNLKLKKCMESANKGTTVTVLIVSECEYMWAYTNIIIQSLQLLLWYGFLSC